MNAAKRILVTDDDARNRKLLDALLRAEGYTVLSAASGQAAIDAVAADPPDLILLDLMMPAMDGFEVVRRLKADAIARDIPILVVTALDDAGSRARLAAAGIAEVVVKPVDRWELKARLDKLLGAKP